MLNLTKIYNTQVKIGTRGYNPQARVSFAPSSLGGKCLRRVYYKYAKAPDERGFTPKSSRILALGTVIGEHLAKVFRDAGILVDYHNPDGKVPVRFGKPCVEFPVNADKLDIRLGLLDGVFIHKNRLFIGEFKSINDRGYQGLRGPKNEHLAQGIICLVLFNKMLRDGEYSHIKELKGFTKAEGVVFLYYQKDSSSVKEFFVSDPTSTFRNLFERITYVQKVGETKKLPPKTEDFCASCSYEQRCGAEELSPHHGGKLTL